MQDIFEKIAIERPTGTEANEMVNEILCQTMEQLGYNPQEIQFTCRIWNKDKSFFECNRSCHEIYASPFSEGFNNTAGIIMVSSAEEIEKKHLKNKIVILMGKAAEEPLMPKDFPFFYPDSHRKVIELLELKQPAAIIALTGKHPMCGHNPFSLFEDGNFRIPTAYAAKGFEKILKNIKNMHLVIQSCSEKSQSRQIFARKDGEAKKRIVFCAHMDTKYETPGALDNAAGVMVLLETMKIIAEESLKYTVDFVPFNGEEYYEVTGQMEYLSSGADDIVLAVNADGIGHCGSQNSVSAYNFENHREWLTSHMKNHQVIEGEQWYAGDHSIFAFRGIPSLALTSSDFLSSVIQITHTSDDSSEKVDYSLILKAAGFAADLITDFL